MIRTWEATAMEISSDQALEALDQVAQAQRRVGVLRGYRYAAPHFFLWGGIWMVGFILTYLLPRLANTAWLVLDVLGCVASVLIVRRNSARAQRSAATRVFPLKFLALLATCAGFLVATYAVMQPNSPAQFAVFPSLLFAAIYIGIGLWRGLRWSIAGLALAALALIGYFMLRPYVLLWMAGAGGRRGAAAHRGVAAA
jgi:F0F1-type ATP synthase assembly protein I